MTNGETETVTARKQRRLLTAWELPELIRPQPLRPRRRPRTAAIQPFYFDLAVFIFSSRYATGSQVLRRFPEQLYSERTAQRHLANMVDHGLIAVASSRGTSPNFPFAYFVTEKGTRFIKTHIPNGEKFQIPATEERRTRGQSLHSLLHELLVTEFALMLDNTARSRGDLQLLSLERRYFRKDNRLAYRVNGVAGRIEPDLGFLPALVTENGEQKTLPMHFVEMELGTHRVTSLRDKLIAYDHWAVAASREFLKALYEKRGELKANLNFRLLLIACDAYGQVGDTRRLLDLFAQAIGLPPKMRDRIWLCRASDLKSHAQDKAPLIAPVWYRAKDAKQWIAEYREAVGRDTGQGNQGRAVFSRQRQFIASKIRSQRQHVLFPFPQTSKERLVYLTGAAAPGHGRDTSVSGSRRISSRTSSRGESPPEPRRQVRQTNLHLTAGAVQ